MRNPRPLPDLNYLRTILRYEPYTGKFYWLRRGSGIARSQAGTLHHHGYTFIGINRKYYAAHRLAYLFQTGEDPPQLVDHINRDKTDNRWANLRLLDRCGNRQNSGVSSRNTSGIVGVCFNERRKLWHARICAAGRNFDLGMHTTKEAAAAARQEAQLRLHIQPTTQV